MHADVWTCRRTGVRGIPWPYRNRGTQDCSVMRGAHPGCVLSPLWGTVLASSLHLSVQGMLLVCLGWGPAAVPWAHPGWEPGCPVPLCAPAGGDATLRVGRCLFTCRRKEQFSFCFNAQTGNLRFLSSDTLVRTFIAIDFSKTGHILIIAMDQGQE